MYFEIHKNPSKIQPYWWVIRSSGNHKILAHSEMYTHKADCLYAIKLVANNAAYARVDDETGEV